MRHEITSVQEGSVAQAHGLQTGDMLLTINGESITDEIDYQALTAQEYVSLVVDRDDQEITVSIHKEDWQPLGLCFGESMALKARPCRNQCVFCFIDQMPPKLRSTLYVKDDDWRFSLMMGNYITLTNVSEAEFERIIKRHASPLYISVHSTNPEIRRRMMNNKHAGDILLRLQRLMDEGIRFHCQIVCCPGLNDGEELTRTISDLAALAPAAISVAVVPVGLTKFRQGLAALTPFDAASAKELLEQLKPLQETCRKTMGTSFVFASDEFYCLSGDPLPAEDWYEDYPQIENGVGLLRQFEGDIKQAAADDDLDAPPSPITYTIVTGVAAAPFMRQWADAYAPPNATVRVERIINHFFGETVTVAGLLTGRDTLPQLTADRLQGTDVILIPANMLRHDRDMFLDGLTLKEFEAALPAPVRIVDNGEDFYNALRNR